MRIERALTASNTSIMLVVILTFSVASTSYAQSDGDDPVNLAANLDRIVEAGQGQELVLRMVKFGVNLEPRKLDNDRDARFICYLGPVAGSHLDYVGCNENEILDHLGAAGVLESEAKTELGAAIFPFRAVGGEYVSRKPVNPKQFEETMEALGPVTFNRELISDVFQSQPLPDGAPGLEELNRFAEAAGQVSQVQSRFDPRIAEAMGEARQALIAESDKLMIQAIEETGLSVSRYNRISELVGQYDSLRRYVAGQM